MRSAARSVRGVGALGGRFRQEDAARETPVRASLLAAGSSRTGFVRRGPSPGGQLSAESRRPFRESTTPPVRGFALADSFSLRAMRRAPRPRPSSLRISARLSCSVAFSTSVPLSPAFPVVQAASRRADRRYRAPRRHGSSRRGSARDSSSRSRRGLPRDSPAARAPRARRQTSDRPPAARRACGGRSSAFRAPGRDRSPSRQPAARAPESRLRMYGTSSISSETGTTMSVVASIAPPVVRTTMRIIGYVFF